MRGPPHETRHLRLCCAAVALVGARRRGLRAAGAAASAAASPSDAVATVGDVAASPGPTSRSSSTQARRSSKASGHEPSPQKGTALYDDYMAKMVEYLVQEQIVVAERQGARRDGHRHAGQPTRSSSSSRPTAARRSSTPRSRQQGMTLELLKRSIKSPAALAGAAEQGHQERDRERRRRPGLLGRAQGTSSTKDAKTKTFAKAKATIKQTSAERRAAAALERVDGQAHRGARRDVRRRVRPGDADAAAGRPRRPPAADGAAGRTDRRGAEPRAAARGRGCVRATGPARRSGAGPVGACERARVRREAAAPRLGSERLVLLLGRAAVRALVRRVADHGVAADEAHVDRRVGDVVAGHDGLAGGGVLALVVDLGLERVVDAAHGLVVALQLGDLVVGRVHLVDLEALAAEGRGEVVGGAADAAHHAQVVARVTRLGERDGAEELGDVRVALVLGLVGPHEVLLGRLALAGEGGREALLRHRVELFGLGEALLEGFVHLRTP